MVPLLSGPPTITTRPNSKQQAKEDLRKWQEESRFPWASDIASTSDEVLGNAKPELLEDFRKESLFH